MPIKGINIVKSCLFCGKQFEVNQYRKDSAKYCSHQCGNTAKARNNRINSSESQRGKGEGKAYPKWFGRHMHRVVVEEKLGRSLLPYEIVHHVDGNKLNNNPANLHVTTRQEHPKIHNPINAANGRMAKKLTKETAKKNIRSRRISKVHREKIQCVSKFGKPH